MSVIKEACEGKFGELVKEGKVASVKFSEKEIESFFEETYNSDVESEQFYPKHIYSTATKENINKDDYIVTLWSKAKLENGQIERNVVSVNKHPNNKVCVGKVKDESTYRNLCDTLTATFSNYDLEYDKNEHSLYTEAGEVVMQNIFFDDVQDAKRWKEMEEEEEKLKEKERAMTPSVPGDDVIPEESLEDIFKEEPGAGGGSFEEEVAPPDERQPEPTPDEIPGISE